MHPDADLPPALSHSPSPLLALQEVTSQISDPYPHPVSSPGFRETMLRWCPSMLDRIVGQGVRHTRSRRGADTLYFHWKVSGFIWDFRHSWIQVRNGIDFVSFSIGKLCFPPRWFHSGSLSSHMGRWPPAARASNSKNESGFCTNSSSEHQESLFLGCDRLMWGHVPVPEPVTVERGDVVLSLACLGSLAYPSTWGVGSAPRRPPVLRGSALRVP